MCPPFTEGIGEGNEIIIILFSNKKCSWNKSIKNYTSITSQLFLEKKNIPAHVFGLQGFQEYQFSEQGISPVK